ncbi:MAG TPA: tRNA pseudouridine(38-40) synthase TruA [Propionibacteriaceae bacterium]|nr:tRNA pseudouridine(38-40) synthase TruA [Propionibacteriaceae bacterium]
MSLARLRLDLGYDGEAFSGWAAQPGRRTVQGELTDAIQQVLRLPEPPQLVVAGRTDAGVHARGQAAHVDLPTDPREAAELAARLERRLTRLLPEDIAVHRVSVAPPGFDARFSAVWRRYTYRLWDEESRPDPLLRRHVTRVRGRLDLERTRVAADQLLGLHDFAAFCKPRDGATTIRTVQWIDVERVADGCGTVEVGLRADAFCHSMVRSVVGALVAVGTGQRTVDWLAEVLASPVRHSQVTVLPAHGLCLEEVGYPDDDRLAERAEQARAVRTLPASEPADSDPADEERP